MTKVELNMTTAQFESFVAALMIVEKYSDCQLTPEKALHVITELVRDIEAKNWIKVNDPYPANRIPAPSSN